MSEGFVSKELGYSLPLVIKISLPISDIISENMLYMPRRGGKGLLLRNEARAYKNEIKELLTPKIPSSLVEFIKLAVSKVSVNVSAKWAFFLPEEVLLTKNGWYKKNDLTNMIKAAEDSIVDCLGFDDQTIVVSESHKYPVHLDDPSFKYMIRCSFDIVEISSQNYASTVNSSELDSNVVAVSYFYSKDFLLK